MATYDKATQEELIDLQRGIHYVLDELVRHKNYETAQITLLEIDQRMAVLINQPDRVRPYR